MKIRRKDIEQRLIILPDDEFSVDARPIVWRMIFSAVNPKFARYCEVDEPRPCQTIEQGFSSHQDHFLFAQKKAGKRGK